MIYAYLYIRICTKMMIMGEILPQPILENPLFMGRTDVFIISIIGKERIRIIIYTLTRTA